jgi:putative oxidoreductase
MVSSVDVGLLLLRVLLAALLAGHGVQKALGWFHGAGITASGALFETWGFRPGRPMVVMAAGCEIVAAVLLLLGLATPLAGAITVGTMAVAAAPNVANGLWALRGGYELPLVYGALGAGLALTGAGSYSLDRVLGLPTTAWIGVPAVALGLLASLGPLARRRAALRTRTTSV